MFEVQVKDYKRRNDSAQCHARFMRQHVDVTAIEGFIGDGRSDYCVPPLPYPRFGISNQAPLRLVHDSTRLILRSDILSYTRRRNTRYRRSRSENMYVISSELRVSGPESQRWWNNRQTKDSVGFILDRIRESPRRRWSTFVRAARKSCMQAGLSTEHVTISIYGIDTLSRQGDSPIRLKHV